MVKRAGYIPRLSEQELASCNRFAQAAVERLRALAGSPYAGLDAEELGKLAAEWYEACAYVLRFDSLVQMEEFLRREVSRIGTDPELKVLRALRGAMDETYRQCGWTAEAISEMAGVVEDVLQDIGVRKEAEPAKAAVEAKEKPKEAAKVELAAKRPKRARVAMTARVQSADFMTGIDEVVQTENVSREGIVFYSSQPYKPGMRLTVILPYTKRPEENKINTMTAQVERTEPAAGKTSVTLKFLRS